MENRISQDKWRPKSAETRGRGSHDRGAGRGWANERRGRGRGHADAQPRNQDHREPVRQQPVEGNEAATDAEPSEIVQIEKHFLDDLIRELKSYQDKEVEDAKKVEVALSISLTEEKRKQLEQKFPGYRFKTKPGVGPGDHPVVATERAIVETSMYHRLSKDKMIADIAGNPARHKTLRRNNVHVIYPKLEPQQFVQQFFWDHCTDVKFCNCDPLICVCHEYDSFMSMYDIQRWEPDSVLKLVNRMKGGYGLAAIRRFPEAIGKLCAGEISYEREATSVVMKVQNDDLQYRIPDETFWFYRTYHTDGTLGMSWSKIDHIGDTYIFLIAKADANLKEAAVEPAKLSLVDSMRDINAYGQVSYDLRGSFAKDPALLTVMTQLEIETADVFSVFNWLAFFRVGKTPLYVPKGVVEVVRVYVAGRARDPTLFQSALQKAKAEMVKYNIPPSYIADSITAATVLAFFVDIRTEEKVLATYLWSYKRPLRSLNELLNFKVQRVFPKFLHPGTIAIGILVSLVTYKAVKTILKPKTPIASVTYSPPLVAQLVAPTQLVRGDVLNMDRFGTSWLDDWFVVSKPTRPAALQSVNSVAASLAAIVFPWVPDCLTRIVRTGTAWIKRVYVFAFRVPGAVILSHPPVHYPDVCMSDFPLPQMHRTATVKMPEEVYCVEKLGCIQYGLAVSIVKPVVARSCVHNEQVAVVARGCLNRPEPAEGAWDDMPKVLKSIFPIIDHPKYMIKGRIRPLPFGEWHLRFPTNRRVELIRARTDYRSGWDTNAKTSGFVKREKQTKTHPEADQYMFPGVILFAPRLIQGFRPVYQYLTGPTTYSMTKYMAWIWNADVAIGVERRADEIRPTTCHIYTSGMNAEGLGRSFEFHVKRLQAMGRIIIKEEDQSRFDAHAGEEAVDLINAPYKWCRAKKRVQRELDKLKMTIGNTRHGIRYRVEATVKSGAGNTSSGDSTVVITGQEEIRRRADIPREHYIEWNTGDDDLNITLLSYAGPLVDSANEVWEDLGFEVKMHVYTDPYDAQYCSGRFYPTSDGIVFGPMIGRVMAKTFHSMVMYSGHNGARWLRAVALGLERDTAFIPVLRTVVRVTLKITAGLKELEIKPEEKIHAMQFHTASPETYEMLYHIYGIDQAQFEDLERFIELNVKTLPATICHPTMDTIVEVDTGDQPRVSAYHPGDFWAALNGPHACVVLAWYIVIIHPCFALMTPDRVLTINELRVIIVAPLTEEILKTTVPVFDFIIPAIELYDIHTKGGQIESYYPTLLLHLLCAIIGRREGGLFLRIAFHSYFNACIVTGVWDKDTPPGATFVSGIKKMAFIGLAITLVVKAPVLATWLKRGWNRLMHALTGNTTMRGNYKGALQELCVKWGINLPVYTNTPTSASTVTVHTAICSVKMLSGEMYKQSSSTTGSAKEAEHHSALLVLKHMESNPQLFNPIHKYDPLQDLVGAISFEWPHERLLIDADNVSCPSEVNRPHFFVRETYVCGTASSLPNWENYISTWEPHFGQVKSAIVPATKDAADIKLLGVITKDPERITTLLTKDKKFLDSAKATGRNVTIAPEFQMIRAVDPSVLAKANLSKNLVDTIMRSCSKYTAVESEPIRLSKYDSF